MTRDRSDKLIEAAVKSDRLAGRAAANKSFAGADFEGWLRGVIGGLAFASALDLCCGTGNQLALYAERPDTEHLVGVDLSGESLAAAGKRLAGSEFDGALELLEADMQTAFALEALRETRFDLVSCCYGLYYAEEPEAVLDAMLARLAPGGAVMIVGPFGPNNRAFFDLLERHMTLPDLVLRSATTFMPKEVVPHLEGKARVTVKIFVNPVCFPDAEAVMAYWRKTTFHDDAAEAAVRRDLDVHFADSDGFVIEKHVMAAIAQDPAP